MPVVINGSGSVTGLSTLAFPNGDGTVTGVATMSGLTNASIPAAKIGAGAVLQVVQKIFSDVTTTTTTYTYVDVTNGSLAITPIGNNSKFLVRMLAQGYQATGGGHNIGISRVIGGTTTRLFGVDGSSGNTWVGGGNGAASNSYTILREYLDAPAVSAGTVVTYKMLLGLWSSGTAYVNYSGYSVDSIITIQEIAG